MAIQALAFMMDIGVRAGVRDNEYYKKIYDSVLVTRQFGQVRSYVVQLENAPDVMCSGGVFPEQDFEGKELQDVGEITCTPHLLHFTSFHGGDRGAIAFTWLPESDATCIAFVESLHRVSDECLTDALLRFFFEHCENVHMKPDWWESLSVGVQSAVIKRMALSATPTADRPKSILTDDGIRFPVWRVHSRRCIGFEFSGRR